MLAASIPVIIHLLNLRKLKRVEFSTLAFLKEIQKTKIRRIKLKQWILLLLRVLIIAALVASFARPAIQNSGISGTAATSKSSSVFLIDDTFSMSVVNENGSSFNQAKEAAKSILEQMQEGDEAAVIPFASASDEFVFSSDFAGVIASLNKLEINIKSGSLEEAVAKAFALLQGSQNINKEIYILSDFQKNKIYSENKYDYSGEFSDVNIYSIAYQTGDVSNASVSELRIENQIFEVNKTIGLSAVISNPTQKSINSVLASLFVNGEREAQQSVDLDPGESKVVGFETTLKSRGLTEFLVELEDDDILHDNRIYRTINIPEELKVGLFYSDPNDSKFVEIVLQGLGERSNIKLFKESISNFEATEIDQFSVLMTFGGISNSGFEKLSNYIKNGGGLIIFPSADNDFFQFAKQLGALGISSNIQVVLENNENSFQTFDEIDFKHPILDNLFEKKEKRQLESPLIRKYYNIGIAGNGRKIISLLGGTPFLSEQLLGQGKILTFNSAVSLGWSDFPFKGFFAPLIYKSTLYLSTNTQHENKYFAGQTVPINLRKNFAQRIRITDPNQVDEIVSMDGSSAKRFINYSNTTEVGTYKVYSTRNLIEYFNVNHDPNESKLEFAQESDLDIMLNKIGFRGNYYAINMNQNITEQIYQTRFGAELWRYFLILALVLVLLEMFLSRNTKNDLAKAI